MCYFRPAKPVTLPLFAASLILLVSGYFTACVKQKTAAPDGDGKAAVTVTVFAAYDFVRAVAGDAVNLRMLLPPGAESHSFEPTPQDLIAIQNSRVFIYVGGESDAWVDRILGSVDTGRLTIVKMLDCVNAVEEEIVEGMENDEEESGEAEYDEHVWTSPRNAVRIVENITDALCGADAGNAELFRTNAAAYIKELDALDAAFTQIAANAKRKTIVFGDRFPFRYFADAYGLTYFAAFPGCSTETEPSAATVAFLIDKIKNEHIPVVFHIELSNERMADTIAEATGARKLRLHACHNVSKRDFDAGKTYVDFMRENVAALREALN